MAYGGEPALDTARLALTHRLLVRPGTPRSVFEIGHGSGALLRRFLDDGASVAGVDPDQLGLRVDPEVARCGNLHVGAVEELDPATVDPVDLVYGVHVIEHVRDPLAALRAARSLTRPGGRLDLLTPAGDGDGPDLWGSAWWMLEDPTHVRFFSARSLADTARRAGFEDVRVERVVLDSLLSDPASAARMLMPGRHPKGVLSSRAVRRFGIATAPLVLTARLVRPRSRSSLHLTARRAG